MQIKTLSNLTNQSINQEVHMGNESVYTQWLKVMLAYKKHSGSWAWILHRITGIGLTFYILVHIILLTGLLKGEAVFNAEMALFQSPVFLFFEWALGSLVIYHAANGVRIVLVDLANGARYQKKVLAIVYALSVIFMLGMGYLIFRPV
jgi:succinate dehydrogenase / fumarate reductase, cytochrome b subunit